VRRRTLGVMTGRRPNVADVALFLGLDLAVIAVAVMLVQSYFTGSEPRRAVRLKE
jgi:hypothetical protein